jgi:hypothetical protein
MKDGATQSVSHDLAQAASKALLFTFLNSGGRIAKACGVPRTRIERIMCEELGISGDPAVRLGRLGVRADMSPRGPYWRSSLPMVNPRTQLAPLGNWMLLEVEVVVGSPPPVEDARQVLLP